MSESWLDAKAKALCGCAFCLRGKHWASGDCHREIVSRGMRAAIDEAGQIVLTQSSADMGPLVDVANRIRALKGGDRG